MTKKLEFFVFVIFVFCCSVSSANFYQGELDAGYLLGTWEIQNETTHPYYRRTTGIVTFYQEHLTIDSGRFAAVGIMHSSEEGPCLPIIEPIKYKHLGNGYFYVWWQIERPTVPDWSSAMVQVIRREGNRVLLIGVGGCGALGADRISILEKIE
jgi:hypothetical protein